MKTTIRYSGYFTFFLLLIASVQGKAQIGIKFGVYNPKHYRTYLNYSSNGYMWSETNAKLNYQGGIFYSKSLGTKFEIQPEIMYMGSNLDHTYTVAAPFIFKYYVLRNFNIQLGTQYVFLSENPKYKNEDTRNLNMSTSFPLGIEYKFKSGFISGRYLILSEIENFEFSIGYKLW
jgi:hypothetical protein